jgi:1,4-dihydroxy-2-naphthoate polyprenyltransferase
MLEGFSGMSESQSPIITPPQEESPAVEDKPSRLRQRREKSGWSFGQWLPAPLGAWYQAARPRSLPATYVPLFIGGALALDNGVFHFPRFLAALIAALALQIASNYVNEYIDFTDAQKTDGMGMVLSRGQLSAEQVRIGAVITLVIGALIGLGLVISAGPVLLLVGVIGVLCVVGYTAGPAPLSYMGLGEVAAFFCFGPLMTFGTYLATSGGLVDPRAFMAGVPIGFTVAAILHANNMRDVEADRQAGKKTLAVRFGERGARLEFAILIYGAYVSLAALILAGVLPVWCLLASPTLFEASWLVRLTTRTNKPAQLHQAQGRTARLHLWLGLLITAGLLLFAFWARG